MATKLTPLGSQFTVNQVLTAGNGINFNQRNADIAVLNDGRFIVAYDSFFDTGGGLVGPDIDIHGHIVNADGTLSGGAFAIVGPIEQQLFPAVAVRGDGSFTTVYTDSFSHDFIFGPAISYNVTS